MTEDTRLVSESFHSCPQKYALAHSNFVLAYAGENNCVFLKTVGFGAQVWESCDWSMRILVTRGAERGVLSNV